METPALTAALKNEARRLGFAQVGACPAVTPTGLHHLGAWLAAGYAGEMDYLPSREVAYEHPRHVLPGARSLLMLAFNYQTVPAAPIPPGQGRISRYAWGSDYHELIRDRLHRLADFLRDAAPGRHARGVIDTAPLLEREFAQLAGMGWVGKNTLLIDKRLGSWFFLAALLTDAELTYDLPFESDHCGTCRACLDACPTQAFVEPYVLDSRRCLSYLTIEHRSAVPEEYRRASDTWLLGCDVCQDVCPWNHRPTPSSEPDLAPAVGANPIDLAELFLLDDDAFRRRFRHTPLWRPKRRGILRNAALILGNQRPPRAVEPLTRGLGDPEPLVRGACAWALGQMGGAAAIAALVERQALEPDAEVADELVAALNAAQSDLESWNGGQGQAASAQSSSAPFSIEKSG